jgi:hypothetical protein
MPKSDPTETRRYRVAGITLHISADLPINQGTFSAQLDIFQAPNPGFDPVYIHHHFALPELSVHHLGTPVYKRPPWEIYRHAAGWTYLGVLPGGREAGMYATVQSNPDHTHGRFYHPHARAFHLGGLKSLTLLPTDQILLARLLADRQGLILHAAGMAIDGQGLLFVGHSGAGKSTMVTLLGDWGQILCDDRVILRRWPEGFHIHGTWHHGDVPTVSPDSAPLRAILLLEQAPENRLELLSDRGALAGLLPSFAVKPLVTAGWWEKTLDVIALIVREIPVYRLRFEKSGRVRAVLEELLC